MENTWFQIIAFTKHLARKGIKQMGKAE